MSFYSFPAIKEKGIPSLATPIFFFFFFFFVVGIVALLITFYGHTLVL